MLTTLGLVLALGCAIILVDANNIILNHNGCPVSPNYEKLLPHENCNQFYQCVNGRRVLLDCPNGLLFNEKISSCDWPQNVVCKRKLHSDVETRYSNNIDYNTISSSILSAARYVCAAAGSDGVLVAHENCNQFYKCSWGLPIELYCPSGLLYNLKNELCDWPDNVYCGKRLIPEDNNNEGSGDEIDGSGITVSDPSQAPAICAEKYSDGVLVAHENCNQFYKCSKGQPVALVCPSGLLYNSNLELCDWPQNVRCENRLIPNEKDVLNNYNPSQAPIICAKQGSDGFLVAHEKCNHFYTCANGIPVIMKCPNGLFFNPMKSVCDWLENANCGQRIVPDESELGIDSNDFSKKQTDDNSYSSQAPLLCSQEDANSLLLAHEKCTHFYECANGNPVAIKCPANLLYNPIRQVCDWPENVKCGNRIIPVDKDEEEKDTEEKEGDPKEHEGYNDPSKAPYICAREDSDSILITHEKCDHFYKCWNGRPLAVRCPGNLFYNPVLGQCDWPANVKCNKRIVA